MTDKALRELDAWIAEHVMGWKQRKRGGAWNPETLMWWGSDLCPDATVSDYKPTTDRAAAMQVLEKCAEKLQSFDICIWKGATGGLFYCGERNGAIDVTTFVKAPTLPLAICKFAQQLFSK